MSTYYQIVLMHDKVSNGGCGKVEAQRLPLVPIIERNIDAAFRSSKEQALAVPIFPHCIDRFVVGKPTHDFLPGAASVVRAEDVRTQIVKTESVHRHVNGLRIEVGGIHLRDFAPGRKFRRSDVAPGTTAVTA